MRRSALAWLAAGALSASLAATASQTLGLTHPASDTLAHSCSIAHNCQDSIIHCDLDSQSRTLDPFFAEVF